MRRPGTNYKLSMPGEMVNSSRNTILINVRERLILGVTAIFLLFGGTKMVAQDTLAKEEVKVLKDFDAQLLKINRIRNYPKPKVTDSLVQKGIFSSRAIDRNIPLLLQDPSYPALEGSLPSQKYNTFVSLAGGFPRRYDISAGHAIQKEGILELLLKGNLSQAESKNIQYQGFRNQNLGASGRYFIDSEWDLNFNAGIDRGIRYLYGHPNADSLNAAALRRQVTIYDIGLRGNFMDDQRSKELSVGFYFSQLQDSYATSERNVRMDGLYTPLKTGDHQLDLLVSLDFTTLTDTLTRKLNNFLFKPSYQYFSDRFITNAGINIYNHRDEFKYFPEIEVKLPVSGDQMIAIIGIDGGLLKNDYHSLYRFNNYIQSRLDTLANTNLFEIHAGVEGAIAGLEYSVTIGWRQMNDFALFNFEPNGGNAGFFRVIFDDVNATYVQAQLVWHPMEELTLDIDGALYFYALDRETKAWHRSNLQSSITANWYPLNSDLSFSGQVWIEGGIPYLAVDGTSSSLETIIDLSLEGRYRINESFDAFLQINNLTNQRWSRWLNYPQFGTNLLAGVRYRVKG